MKHGNFTEADIVTVNASIVEMNFQVGAAQDRGVSAGIDNHTQAQQADIGKQ